MHSGAHVAVRDDSDHSVSNELIVIAFAFPSILLKDSRCNMEWSTALHIDMILSNLNSYGLTQKAL